MALADGTALYRIWGEADLLLYIGISDEFGTRWKQHAKAQPWWGEMRRLTIDAWYASREQAEAEEVTAIKAEKPKYNVAHSVTRKPRPRRRLQGGEENWAALTEAAPRATGTCMDRGEPCRRLVDAPRGCFGMDSVGYPCLLTGSW